MTAVQQACFALLLSAFVIQGVYSSDSNPVYNLVPLAIPINNSADQTFQIEFNTQAQEGEFEYEWESYDGWYNNLAHPDWGGAGKFVVFVVLQVEKHFAS